MRRCREIPRKLCNCLKGCFTCSVSRVQHVDELRRSVVHLYELVLQLLGSLCVVLDGRCGLGPRIAIELRLVNPQIADEATQHHDAHGALEIVGLDIFPAPGDA